MILSANLINGQTPIIPIFQGDGSSGQVENAYYKDTYNDYDRFEGTWRYANNGDTLEIVLKKKEMQYIKSLPKNYFEDILIGEYRYVENGIEKLNTLDNLNINFNDPYNYNIVGGIIRKYDPSLPSGYCAGCEPGDVKVLLDYYESIFDQLTLAPSVNMEIKAFEENGIEKLQLFVVVRSYGISHKDDTDAPSTTTIPAATEFVLEKVE